MAILTASSYNNK